MCVHIEICYYEQQCLINSRADRHCLNVDVINNVGYSELVPNVRIEDSSCLKPSECSHTLQEQTILKTIF